MATFSTTYNPDQRGPSGPEYRSTARLGRVDSQPWPTGNADPTPTPFKRDVAHRFASSCLRTASPLVRECLQRDLARFVGWYLVRGTWGVA